MIRFINNIFKLNKLLLIFILFMTSLVLLLTLQFIENKATIQNEENALFKKYTISFKSEVDKSQWSSSGDTINIFYKDSKSSLLEIKKTFKDSNEIYIDPGDNKKLIVLVSKVKNPYKYKVVLDPGHGGRDPGYTNGNLREKNFTLKICCFMYNDLMFNGYRVILTRQTDIELDKNIKIDLVKRANIANNNKADVFVSIHINAGNVKDKNFKNYQGITTYYYPNKDKDQNNERLKLAKEIQNNAADSDGWKSRKILAANYSVLRNTKMQSILVECGFLTNKDDIKRLLNDTTLSNLGINIDKGIMEYLKNKKS